MEKDVVLKKAIIGGFDCRQVIEYIGVLKAQQSKSAADIAELQTLRGELEDLQTALDFKNEEITRLTAEASKYAGNAHLNEISAKIVRESAAYADSYIEGVRMLAKNINDSTNAKLSTAKERVDSMLTSIEEISDSVAELYRTVGELKLEYESYNDASDEAVIVSEQIELPENFLLNDDEIVNFDESRAELVKLVRGLKKKYRMMAQSTY